MIKEEFNFKPYVPELGEALKATIGVKFSNNIYINESFLKQHNIKYNPEDLEETPMGLCLRIKKDEMDS